MSRAATVAVLLAAIAAGCLRRSSAHGVMTAAQAQAQAVRDGLAKPELQHGPSSWRCTSTPPYFGLVEADLRKLDGEIAG